MIDELCQLDQAIQDGRKIAKTSLCKEAAEVLKAIFHIQDQEHKTIIRDESKIKTNEVEKKRSGKWIKTMKPLKKFYEKYGERVYVTGFGVGCQVNCRIRLTKSLPYFFFLYSPIPLIDPKSSMVVGREMLSRCNTLSDNTI